MPAGSAASPSLDSMKRVLVSEQLALSGLEAMQEAGLDVDVRLGLSPAELLGVVPGASALVIRSATQVTPRCSRRPTSSSWWDGPASVSTTSTSKPRPDAA